MTDISTAFDSLDDIVRSEICKQWVIHFNNYEK